MTEQEKEALSSAICNFIHELVQQADKFNIDRDSYIRAAAGLFQLMSEVSTFERFDVGNRATGAKVDAHTREGLSRA